MISAYLAHQPICSTKHAGVKENLVAHMRHLARGDVATALGHGNAGNQVGVTRQEVLFAGGGERGWR